MFNTSGYSSYSNEVTVTIPQIALNAPSNLTATGASNTRITLNWQDNSNNEDGFIIERSTTPGTGFIQIVTVGANVTAYTDITLTGNSTYYYRVRAFNAGGSAAYSNKASAVTNPDLPNPPSGLTATAVSNTQINLTWVDNSSNELGFKIERKTGVAGTYTEIATLGANVQSYNSTGLTGLTQYFFRVRAYNADGNTAYTAEKDATTLIDPPRVPSGLTATAISSSQINLSWQDNATNEDGFQIERKAGAAGTYAVIATIGASAVLNVTYSDNTVAGNTQYFYRIRSFNVSWTSPASNEASATTPAAAIATPTGLTATAVSKTQINLAWRDNSFDETGFLVERKTGLAGTFVEIATVGANVTSYSSTGLNSNVRYFYRVRARNLSGASAYSNVAQVTTLPNPPAAPGGLTATLFPNFQIKLAWTDNSANEDSFKIERKSGPAGTYAQIAVVGKNVISYLDTGLNPATQYFYRIRASNIGGHSGYSAEASLTTLPNSPAAPSNLTATAVSATRISLAWQDNSANEDGFLIERKMGSASTYKEMAAVDANATSYPDTGLTEGATYFYRVRAFNIGGHSAYSNEVEATPSNGANVSLNKPTRASSNMAKSEVIIPEKISLAPNYPNPFNPSTTISYSLPKGMHVTLKVINTAGQEVATLAEGYQNRGRYHVTFNAKKLPSGVYYAVLQAGEVTQVRRMLFTK